MAKAFIHLFRLHEKRRKMLEAGFQAAGFEIGKGFDFASGDIVILWNRRASEEHIAKLAVKRGSTLIIMENGYLGADQNGRKLFALAKDHHLGAGDWYVGNEERWREQSINLQPWRAEGKHVLLLLQRGIGERGITQPKLWPTEALQKLRKITWRPIRVRSHPGNSKTAAPLEDDLKNAHCVITWASGAALKSLIAGVPVFFAMKSWIGQYASIRFENCNIEEPLMSDEKRYKMLHHLSWAQWSREEIANGIPFQYL